jgi:transposase
MSRQFRAYTLDQLFLLPPSIQDWVPEGHLARFIGDVAEELDLSRIYAVFNAKDNRGRLGYHPLLLTRLLLYGYCTGVRSSRQIEKGTYDDIAFRYLAADQHPDHDTIAAFRQDHLELLAGLFAETIRLCQKAGLVKLGVVAIDGTKMRANANSRRSATYSHLVERDKELEALSKKLLEEAAKTDADEDARFGKGKRGDELPPELATVEQRRAKIREAKKALEEEAKQRAEEAAKERAEAGGKSRNAAQRKRWQRAKPVPKPEARHNFVDSDSRIMKDSGANAFLQGYNAQIAVDGEAQVIVAATVTNQVNDKNQLLPMVERVKTMMGRDADVVLADAGYWKEESITAEAVSNIHLLVPPDGHVTRDKKNPLPAHAPQNEAAKRMREKLSQEAEKQLYQKRQGIVEPVIGQIKEQRGIRRMMLRSIAKVRAEWNLICLTHNLLKLFRHTGTLATTEA